MLQIIQHKVSWQTRFNASEVVTSITTNVYISLSVMQV